MADLTLSFACDEYSHTKPLTDGTTKPDGITLRSANLSPAEVFKKLLRDRELDVAELGLTFYLGTLGAETPPYIALPVFPSRSFRHSAIYVTKESGIERPADLAGKRIGELHFYGHDAGVWSKGILSDEYGLPPATSDDYHVGGVLKGHEPWDWLPFDPPANIRVENTGPDRTLDAMLENGEIDALYSAHVPPSLRRAPHKVRRLFDGAEALERAYFAKTGIFPIMHTVVVRRDLYNQHPWIARSLYDAFKAAKRKLDDFYRASESQMHRYMMIPFLSDHCAENRALMGDDPWPYGVEANRKTLDAFLRYHHEQGISKRRFAVEELFAPETLGD